MQDIFLWEPSIKISFLLGLFTNFFRWAKHSFQCWIFKVLRKESKLLSKSVIDHLSSAIRPNTSVLFFLFSSQLLEDWLLQLVFLKNVNNFFWEFSLSCCALSNSSFFFLIASSLSLVASSFCRLSSSCCLFLASSCSLFYEKSLLLFAFFFILLKSLLCLYFIFPFIFFLIFL